MFLCPLCNKTIDVIKSVKDYNRKETCECGQTMHKVFNAPTIKTNDGVKR